MVDSTPKPNSNLAQDQTQDQTQTQTRAQKLLSTTQNFCQAFLSPPSPTTILKTYFTPTDPKIKEHGPSWAQSRLPFLGKTFIGRDECIRYFEILSQVLEFQPGKDTFPGREGFVVDVNGEISGEEDRVEGESEDDGNGGKKGKGVVFVVAKGRFKSLKTGKSWEERFVYRFSGFDEEGRIGFWEIWADPLSAWEAVGGD